MEIPHDLRSLEAGRPSGTGRPSSLSPSTERTTAHRADGAGTRSADERATESASRRAGAKRRARADDRHTSPGSETSDGVREASFDDVLTRERAVAAAPTPATAAARRSEPQAPAASSANADAPAEADPARRARKRSTTSSAGADGEAAALDELAGPDVHTLELARAGDTTHTNTPPAEGESAPIGELAGAPDAPAEIALAADDGATADPAAAPEPLGTELAARDVASGARLAPDLALVLEPRSHAEASSALHAVAAHATEPATGRPAPLHTAELAPPPPADPARAADILRQVRLQIVPELKSAVIELAPAELGRVSIALEFEDRSVVARVRAEQPEALSALQRHLPELRAALTRQGIDTQRFEFALGFQDGQRGRETQQDSRRAPRTASVTDSTTHATRAAVPLARALAAGGVDTYA